MALLLLALSGCVWQTPCEPQWYANWHDQTWYNQTIDHPDAQLWPATMYDLGIEDPALAPYEPFVTRNLQGPGAELYHERDGYTLWLGVAADATLESRRADVTPMLEALSIDVDATFEKLAKDRSVGSATQSGDDFTIHSYNHKARVEADVQAWWDDIGGIGTANVTERDDGAYLQWDGWALEIERLGHDITAHGVAFHIAPDGEVQTRADEEIGSAAFLAGIAAFSADNNVTAPDVTPRRTNCVETE